MIQSTIPQPEGQAPGLEAPIPHPQWSALNLGCGQRFHPAWTNLDLQPAHPSVRRWDVTQPLPFADGSFDAVYHSHLLEHLPRAQALPFLTECRRVLKPGGVLRLAVPNLEAIARLYLHVLEEAWHDDEEALAQHRWLVLELYDQVTREAPGGAMLNHLQNEQCSLAWYRLGLDGTILRRELQSLTAPVRQPTWRDRMHGWLFGSWRERLIRRLLGKDYALLQVGRFRRTGEVHHWMYDRVSLREMLKQAGFRHFRCVGPRDSAIANWNDYHLDTTPDGDPCKPDSIFVEAER
jgi:predicted SAM-dependent methyltransferase